MNSQAPPAANAVVINGAGAWTADTTFQQASGFFVRPVRPLSAATALYYNPITFEISYLSSSLRYKKDVHEVTAGESARVWDLRPVSYRGIEDTDNTGPISYGFIGEEVAEVDPRLCAWGKDEDGAPQVESVHYVQVIPLLLMEAKQLKAQVEELQAAREQDRASMEKASAEIARLEAARQLDRTELEALKTSMETLLLAFQQHQEAR